MASRWILFLALMLFPFSVKADPAGNTLPARSRNLKAANKLLDAGKFEEALAAYAALGEARSSKVETWRLNNMGLCYLRTEKPAEALPLLRKAVEVEPGNSVAWNNLGVALENSGDFDNALEAYRQSVQISRKAGQTDTRGESNLKKAELKAKLKDEKP